MDAVRQWQYKPVLLNGNPVEVETTLSVEFCIGCESAEEPRPVAAPSNAQLPAQQQESQSYQADETAPSNDVIRVNRDSVAAPLVKG